MTGENRRMAGNYWSSDCYLQSWQCCIFFKKLKKTPGNVIILHLCTKNPDDMIYSSWDVEHDGLKLVILGHLLHFYPLKTQKFRMSEKWRRLLEISSFYTCAPKITIMWCTVFDNSETDRIFGHFLNFYPPSDQKIKILKKWKKHLEMSSFHTCVYQKSQSYDVYFSRNGVPDRIVCHFWQFFALLCP